MNNVTGVEDIGRMPTDKERVAARVLTAFLLMFFAPITTMLLYIQLGEGGFLVPVIVFSLITLLLATIYFRASSNRKSKRLSPNALIIAGVIFGAVTIWSIEFSVSYYVTAGCLSMSAAAIGNGLKRRKQASR